MARRLLASVGVFILWILPAAAQSVTAGGCTMSQSSLVFEDPVAGLIFGPVFLDLTCKETEWLVFVENTNRGLTVGPAYLARAMDGPFLQVLKSANVAENFTIYHTGNVRLHDTQYSNSTNAIPALDSSEIGPGGMLVTIPGESQPRVAAELRSRGLGWLCTWGLNDDLKKSVSRQGMEMVIWGIYDTGNYDYIYEYTFRDDGQMSFRVGATGWNNASDVTPDIPHTHQLLWRVDVDLGSNVNSASAWTHNETSLYADDTEVPFNNGFEGAMDLDQETRATVIIEDATKNAAGHRIGYELHPLDYGVSRHYATDEAWTLHDVWITRYSAAEKELALTFDAGSPCNPCWHSPDDYLVGLSGGGHGISDHQSIKDQDIVLWVSTSAHHEPHDEDQATDDPSHGYEGITLIHWSGFDLVPHNLFDANPLGGPDRRSCDGYPKPHSVTP